MPVMICSADGLRERRSLCFYEEELNWPVFWCRIWNCVSFQHPVADHTFVHLFSKSHDASPQLPNFVLTFLFSMKCTESDEEEPIKGKESQLQFSCFINQEVKYLATGLRLVCDFKNVFVWYAGWECWRLWFNTANYAWTVFFSSKVWIQYIMQTSK